MGSIHVSWRHPASARLFRKFRYFYRDRSHNQSEKSSTNIYRSLLFRRRSIFSSLTGQRSNRARSCSAVEVKRTQGPQWTKTLLGRGSTMPRLCRHKERLSRTFRRAIAASLSPITFEFEEAALESSALIRHFSNFSFLLLLSLRFSFLSRYAPRRYNIYKGLSSLMPLLLSRATIAFLMNAVIYNARRLLLSVYWARKPSTSKGSLYHLCVTRYSNGYRRVIDRRGFCNSIIFLPANWTRLITRSRR